MKKLVSLAVIALISCQLEAQQQVVSGQSKATTFQMQREYERGLPPNLYAELQFDDENGNGIIEAMETALLHLKIINQGKGPAQDLDIQITDNSPDPDFTFVERRKIPIIMPGASAEFTLPFSAGFDVKTLEHKLEITVLEKFGYDMDPAYLVLNTMEYQSPELAFSGYEVVDIGEGTGAIIEDGQIQAGEMVKVKVYVQNIGQNVAKNVKYKAVSKSPNVYLESGTGELGDFVIGEVKHFWITVSPNKRVDISQNLPVYLSMDLDFSKGKIDDYALPLALNQPPPKTEILEVKADIEKLQQQVARFEYSSSKFKTNVGSLYNIKQVSPSKTHRSNAVAVVFGIEEYEELPPAPYAENDANVIKDYFRERLGIETVVVFTSDEARGFIFDDIFNPDIGELQRSVVKGQTDLFVFYSGHGVPSKDGDNVYLFPADGKTSRLETQGYNIDKFYENLEKLGARSTTVFIDACFSGGSKHSNTIQQENLVAMKGIRIQPKVRKPWMSNPNFSVFTSSMMEETSLGFDASQTGLFTYFLCAGMQGKADANEDHQITAGELSDYVHKNVVETSKKISGIQTPTFNGNPDMVLIEY